MSLITRMLKQTCVYWPLESVESAVADDFDNYGQPQVSTPSEISCRWEDVSEEFIDAQGTRQISRAKVYVDQDVDVGGILMLGELADITDEENIKENDGAYEIKRFDKF
ncbi:unnamed protein product, partial [marine sediment metagenome]